MSLSSKPHHYAPHSQLATSHDPPASPPPSKRPRCKPHHHHHHHPHHHTAVSSTNPSRTSPPRHRFYPHATILESGLPAVMTPSLWVHDDAGVVVTKPDAPRALALPLPSAQEDARADGDAHVLNDDDIPSPPASLSENSQLDGLQPHELQPHELCSHASQPARGSAELCGNRGSPEALSQQVAVQRRLKLVEDFAPSVRSQDSEYFTFVPEMVKPQLKVEVHPLKPSAPQTLAKAEVTLESEEEESEEEEKEKEEKKKKKKKKRNDASGGDDPLTVDVGEYEEVRKPYYTRAFDYVLTEVLRRYSDVLRPCEVQFAQEMQSELSTNALSLFVRIYRRKQPCWYRVHSLAESYGKDIEIEEAINELFDHRILISSIHAATGTPETAALIAKQLLRGMKLDAMRDLCSATAESLPMKKLNMQRLRAGLESILSIQGSDGKRRSKFKQTTLSGLSPLECLTKAIMKSTGHAVKIPEHILLILQRIHFLFFLGDGHDSPNIILADTGKTKFPAYKCEPKNRIFPSDRSLLNYELAVDLEVELNAALEVKDYLEASDLGSIAELEVRRHRTAELGVAFDVNVESQCSKEHNFSDQSPSCEGKLGSLRSMRRTRVDHEEVMAQLRHPFFRRYTSQWVYARAAWHSVHALERLSEYESAVKRLKLLLSTSLMPKRRGKCLNRLTINLSKHLGRHEEALCAIKCALQDDAPVLQFGDRIGLINRGINIHRKLSMPAAEDRAKAQCRKKVEQRNIARAEVINSRPPELGRALSRSTATVSVRKIFGISRQIAKREAGRAQKDPWQTFQNENSLDSVGSLAVHDAAVKGKSVFSSLGSSRRPVTVEQYCLEWYLGKNGWHGKHDEGCALRFLFCLLLWECAVFAPIEDVFQTPYQDRPLDLYTEAFYPSRNEGIVKRLADIEAMDSKEIREVVEGLYSEHELTRAVGCAWKKYSSTDLSHIAAGLGGQALAHCCNLLAQDYAYWGGGLPDLTLWRSRYDPLSGEEVYETLLVEAKSARDTLSERQRAWLIELQTHGVGCEVCKVVEKVTTDNAAELEGAKLDEIEIGAIDTADMEAEENE